MGFSKTGAIFKIASSEIIDLNKWENLKKASINVDVQKETTVQKDAIEKQSDFDVVASVDTDKFVYIHTTIMAGVKTASNGFYVTSETEKFINDNHDAWRCEDLVDDCKTFKRALTFVEHVQDLEKAKGKCIDVIARQLPDTILVDVLFSVDKKHADLVDNIKNGIINAVSMGCSTEKTVCTICGNEAKDQSKYCSHIKNQKGSMVKCEDGKTRRAAEICKGNTFFDVSLVANPAFAGAVFRKILSSEQLGTKLLANLISSKIESFNKNGETFLKAASTEIAIKKDGSINVKNGENQIQEHLPENEVKNINSILANENTATKFLSKIIGKFFNKDSNHPITHDVPSNYFIDDEDHSPIPVSERHVKIRQEAERQSELRLRIPVEEGITPRLPTTPRTASYECYSCGYTDELWQIRASSIDNGVEDAFLCPKCGFISETSKIIKKAFTLTTLDRLQLQDLGYTSDDIKVISSSSIKNILANEINKEQFQKTADISHSILKSLKENGTVTKVLEELQKGQVFIASKNIPVDNDEGILHFDEHGASVITKNEKLTFVGTVENGEYGFFKTESGEEFFAPIDKVKKKQ